MKSRQIEFEALYNVRDLGGMEAADGKHIRKGLLFRGDQPFFASDADKARFFEIGVRKMIDFRSIVEHEDKPDPEIEGIFNLYLPAIEDVRPGITHGEQENLRLGQLLMSGARVEPSFVDDYMGNMYRQFVNDDFSNAQYARFVDEVIASAREGAGVYWHCTAGKDRAGFAAVILLEALGVSRDDIVADYLLTNDCLSDFTKGMIARLEDRLPTQAAKDLVIRFFSAYETYLSAAYDEAETLYGSFSAYLEKALQIDDAKHAELQELLLES